MFCNYFQAGLAPPPPFTHLRVVLGGDVGERVCGLLLQRHDLAVVLRALPLPVALALVPQPLRRLRVLFRELFRLVGRKPGGGQEVEKGWAS